MIYVYRPWVCLKQRQHSPLPLPPTNRRGNVDYSLLIWPNKFSCKLLLQTSGGSSIYKQFLLTEFVSKRREKEELGITVPGDHVWDLLFPFSASVREMLNLVWGHLHLCFLNEDKYEKYLHLCLLGVEPSCIFGRCFISKESSLFWKLERPRAAIIVWFLKPCLHALWVSGPSHA